MPQACHSTVRLPEHPLLDWVVFNYLAGHGGAHAGNLALLLHLDGPALAPFHGLRCSAARDDASPSLAMKIGDQSRPEWIRDPHWQRFAEDCGLTWRLVRDRLRHMATRLPGLAAEVRGELEAEAGTDPILDRIEEVIAARCRHILNHAGAE